MRLRSTPEPITASARGVTPNEGGFVTRKGTLLFDRGKPFYVAGANTHYLPWGTQHEVDSVLQDAVALNLNVVRFFVTSFVGSLDGSVPTVWGWPWAKDSAMMAMNGVYTVYWDPARRSISFNDGPDGFRRVDYVIARAAELGLKLDVAFMDFWEYAGGTQQMRAWYGSTGGIQRTGIDAPAGANPHERYTFFWSDPRTRADYKKLVAYTLNRVNTYTGVAYKDDPTIFAWDLMNEPEFETPALAKSWLTEMSAYVKSIDRRHLLLSGNEGFYGGNAGGDPDAELAISDLDAGVWHSYPRYHDVTPDEVVALVARHAESAKRANKPVLLQEFSYGSEHADQVAVYEKWFDALYRNEDSAGWLLWRLTGRMQNGQWAGDNGEHFDVHNDGGPMATLLARVALRQRNKGQIAVATAASAAR